MTVAAPLATVESPRYQSRVQIFSNLSPDERNFIAAQARSLRKARGEFV